MAKISKSNKSLLVSFFTLLFSFVLVIVATFAWFVFKNPELNDVGGGFKDQDNYRDYVKFGIARSDDGESVITDGINFYPGNYFSLEVEIENIDTVDVEVEFSFMNLKVLYDNEYYAKDDFTGDEDIIFSGSPRFIKNFYETYDYYYEGTYDKIDEEEVDLNLFRNFINHSTRATRFGYDEDISVAENKARSSDESEFLSEFTDAPFFTTIIQPSIVSGFYKCFFGFYFDPYAYEVFDGIELRNSNPYMFQVIQFTLSVKFKV